jgi:hypothetical protein
MAGVERYQIHEFHLFDAIPLALSRNEYKPSLPQQPPLRENGVIYSISGKIK